MENNKKGLQVSIWPLNKCDKEEFIREYVSNFDSDYAAQRVIASKTGLKEVDKFAARSVANEILKDTGIVKKLKEWFKKHVDADEIKWEAYKFLKQCVDERAKGKAIEINAKIHGLYNEVAINNTYNLTWSAIVEGAHKENRIKEFTPVEVKELPNGKHD